MCGGSGENVCVFGRMCGKVRSRLSASGKVFYFDVKDCNTSHLKGFLKDRVIPVCVVWWDIPRLGE